MIHISKISRLLVGIPEQVMYVTDNDFLLMTFREKHISGNIITLPARFEATQLIHSTTYIVIKYIYCNTFLLVHFFHSQTNIFSFLRSVYLFLILIFALLNCPALPLTSVSVGLPVSSSGPSHFVIYILFLCSLSSLFHICF